MKNIVIVTGGAGFVGSNLIILYWSSKSTPSGIKFDCPTIAADDCTNKSCFVKSVTSSATSESRMTDAAAVIFSIFTPILLLALVIWLWVEAKRDLTLFNESIAS